MRDDDEKRIVVNIQSLQKHVTVKEESCSRILNAEFMILIRTGIRPSKSLVFSLLRKTVSDGNARSD